MAALDNASKATDNTENYADSELSTPLLPAMLQNHCWQKQTKGWQTSARGQIVF